MKNKKMGFTLVELMAVIIIISLIAILTFPNIINQINYRIQFIHDYSYSKFIHLFKN